MNIKNGALILALAAALMSTNVNMAQAKEYFYDEALGDLPKSTSTELPTVIGAENIYLRDVSKNTALLPPPFGSPQMLQANGTMMDAITNATSDITPIILPNITTTEKGSLLYADSTLGTLTIPKLGLSVKVYEGENNLSKGVGHFTDTAVFTGNVAIAGHNRGVNSYFGEIHNLKAGDEITYTTKLGTKKYAVTSVRKINAADFSFLRETSDNRLTLITCVKNEPNFRLCVQAREKSLTIKNPPPRR